MLRFTPVSSDPELSAPTAGFMEGDLLRTREAVAHSKKVFSSVFRPR
jgi:hypothetical protein